MGTTVRRAGTTGIDSLGQSAVTVGSVTAIWDRLRAKPGLQPGGVRSVGGKALGIAVKDREHV
jgi:hypothetical protein